MKKFGILPGFLLAVGALLLTAAGASRFINGTEIPQSVTLLYSTGAQSATLGATTTTTLASSGAVTMASTLGVVGAVSVTGALGVTGAVTLKDDELYLKNVSADGTASTFSAQGTIGASGLVSSLVTHAATVGTNGDSYTLPDDAVGAVRMVCNAAAANNMDVFPFTSDSINKESANAAINLLAGECTLCVKMTAVKWGCVIGAAN